MLFQKIIFLAGCFGLLSGIAYGSQPACVKSAVRDEQLQRLSDVLLATWSDINNRVHGLEDWTLENIKVRSSGQYVLSSKYKTPSDLGDNVQQARFLHDQALNVQTILFTNAQVLISNNVMTGKAWALRYGNASRLITHATWIRNRLEQAAKEEEKQRQSLL